MPRLCPPLSRSSRGGRLTLWVDAQLSPFLADWISENLSIEAVTVRDCGLRDAEDVEIFEAARAAGVVVLTKDHDFVDLLESRGSPPQVLWLTLGNTSNAHLKSVLKRALPMVLDLIRRGEPLVEISRAT